MFAKLVAITENYLLACNQVASNENVMPFNRHFTHNHIIFIKLQESKFELLAYAFPGFDFNSSLIYDARFSLINEIIPNLTLHYNDVIMSAIASQITSLTIVYPTVYSGADQIKHQNSSSLAFVRGIHRWPVNSPPVTRKMLPFDDVIMG